MRFYYDRTFLKQIQSAEQDTDGENQTTRAKLVERGFEMVFFSCIHSQLFSQGGTVCPSHLVPNVQDVVTKLYKCAVEIKV